MVTACNDIAAVNPNVSGSDGGLWYFLWPMKVPTSLYLYPQTIGIKMAVKPFVDGTRISMQNKACTHQNTQLIGLPCHTQIDTQLNRTHLNRTHLNCTHLIEFEWFLNCALDSLISVSIANVAQLYQLSR